MQLDHGSVETGPESETGAAGSRWTLRLWSLTPHDKQVASTLLPPGGEQCVLIGNPGVRTPLLVCFSVDFWSDRNKECLRRALGKFWVLNTTCFIRNKKKVTAYAVGAHPTCTQLRLQRSLLMHSLCIMPEVSVHQVRYQMNSKACSHVRTSERHTQLPPSCPTG